MAGQYCCEVYSTGYCSPQYITGLTVIVTKVFRTRYLEHQGGVLQGQPWIVPHYLTIPEPPCLGYRQTISLTLQAEPVYWTILQHNLRFHFVDYLRRLIERRAASGVDMLEDSDSNHGPSHSHAAEYSYYAV